MEDHTLAKDDAEVNDERLARRPRISDAGLRANSFLPAARRSVISEVLPRPRCVQPTSGVASPPGGAGFHEPVDKSCRCGLLGGGDEAPVRTHRRLGGSEPARVGASTP
jgi:hypothetical protein